MNSPVNILELFSRLRDRYGHVESLEPDTPFALVLFENGSYLVDDERRATTFQNLKTTVGIAPRAILDADDAILREALAGGGPMLANRIRKVRAAAEMVGEELDGDLDRAIE
jgi:hypothetical protein